MEALRVEPLLPADWVAVAAIYGEGIDGRLVDGAWRDVVLLELRL